MLFQLLLYPASPGAISRVTQHLVGYHGLDCCLQALMATELVHDMLLGRPAPTQRPQHVQKAAPDTCG